MLEAEDWPKVPQEKWGNAVTCLRGSTSLPDYIPGWADLPPVSPIDACNKLTTTITLIPYGATVLRVSEFPTAVNTGLRAA